jgi:hypothetical protein
VTVASGNKRPGRVIAGERPGRAGSGPVGWARARFRTRTYP